MSKIESYSKYILLLVIVASLIAGTIFLILNIFYPNTPVSLFADTVVPISILISVGLLSLRKKDKKVKN